MDSGKAHDIFMEYSAAMAYVEVELPNGDRSIGSAFHVGEGVFVTARHVLEENRILQIASTNGVYVPLIGEEAERATTVVVRGGKRIPSHSVSNGTFELDQGPFFHLHDDVDVAIFRVREIDPYTPVIPLGSHLDDWLGEGDFVLSEAIVLGYPPIPMTKDPILIGARAEVNAQVDLYDASHVHFILSSMPRGGFSGGLAFSEYGFALGVVTRSLGSNYAAVELGYMTVMSIEPIYECLADHYLIPDIQAEGWDGLWNTTNLWFTDPALGDSERDLAVAEIALFDDHKRYTLTLMCDRNLDALESSLGAAESVLSGYRHERSEVRPGTIRLNISMQDEDASAKVTAAARAASTVLVNYGYEPAYKDHALLPPANEDL